MKAHTMNRTFAFLCIILCTSLLIGCTSLPFDIRRYIPGNWDAWQGERPIDYPNSCWESTAPAIWFEVPEEENEEGDISPIGEATIEGRTVGFTMLFDRAISVFFYGSDGEGVILSGTCCFSENELIIEIDKESDTLFQGAYESITFIRSESE